MDLIPIVIATVFHLIFARCLLNSKLARTEWCFQVVDHCLKLVVSSSNSTSLSLDHPQRNEPIPHNEMHWPLPSQLVKSFKLVSPHSPGRSTLREIQLETAGNCQLEPAINPSYTQLQRWRYHRREQLTAILKCPGMLFPQSVQCPKESWGNYPVTFRRWPFPCNYPIRRVVSKVRQRV